MDLHIRSRRTGHVNDEKAELDHNYHVVEENKLENKIEVYREACAIITFLWLLFTLVWSASFAELYPSVRSSNDLKGFSEERARSFLKEITAYGPRPTGSVAAETYAVNLFLEKFDDLQKKFDATNYNRFEFDIQRPTDCFDISFRGFYTLCYFNVTNIVARIGPKEKPSEHALMINCHFDTVFDSPGATDDAVSCSIMIEILTYFSAHQETLKYDIVFLFNGAEEYGLHASHGFITQHPWRHYIRAFINLEGAGSSGREVLFQAGPKNSWLLQSYLQNAPHPYCSVMGQELFQSGIIPSDTDFRIFRDFGGLSGLDIAYVVNGWIYHTEYDKEDKIASGAIQRAGDNVLSVVSSIMKNTYLEQPWRYEDSAKWVYYDFLGMFTIYYSKSSGEYLNYFFCFLTWLMVGMRLKRMVYSPNDLSKSLLNHLFVFGFMFLSLLGVIALLYVFGLTQIWWKEPNFIYVFFILPLLIVGFKAHSYLQNDYRGTAFWDKQEKYMDSVNVILAVCIYLLTYYKISSAYILLNFLSLSLMSQFVCKLFVPQRRTAVKAVVTLIIISPALIYFSYIIYQLFQLYVPITGRSGTKINPLIIIGVITLVTSFIIVLNTNCLIFLNEKYHRINTFRYLFVVFLFFILATFNNISSPYSNSYEHPRLRRMIAINTHRTITDHQDQVISDESAIFIQGLDYNHVSSLPKESFFEAQSPNCTGVIDSYCRLPYYNSIHTNFPPHETLWKVTNQLPKLRNEVELHLIEKVKAGPKLVSCTFSVIGEFNRASLHLSPINGYELYSWSMTKIDLDVYGKRPTYFVTLTQGSADTDEKQFTIVLSKEDDVDVSEPAIEVALVTLVESPAGIIYF
ncbi:unnamed protein product [Auanema sp. JU1783]|nr:unnamed protein product [Auanema sp. JU1783]